MAKMDFKKLAFDHVEKAVFGVMALVAVSALATTSWKPYEGTPQQIMEKIDQGRRTLASNTWPEEEAEKYKITAETTPANILHQRLFAEFSPTPVEMSGKMMVDVFGSNEPVREPDLIAPQDPIVSSSRVFIHLADTPPEEKVAPDAALAAAKPKTADDAIPDEFRKRSGAAAAMGANSEMLAYEAAASELRSQDTFIDYGSMLNSEGGGGAKLNLNGKGYHFVSVRAVFPLRDQITKYADAIHKSFHAAAQVFDIRDFELERQTAQPGDDPWTGEWEKVDLDVAADILGKAAGFDAEVVNSMITNAVVTMPLPMRISGEWRKQATHPRIEKFELNDDQIALEVEMQRRLLDEAVAQKKELDANTVKRGGFSQFQFDSRQLTGDMLGVGMYDSGSYGGNMPVMEGSSAMGSGRRPGQAPSMGNKVLDKLVADMAKGAANPAQQEKQIRDWIQARVSAEGELLLFRYLDFNVEPGKTYRYRLRFVLANPNFGKRIADAGGLPHVVEGEIRQTPWSTITAPVTVEDDVKYFLTDIREPAGRVLPMTRLDVFEWDPSHGTFMNSPLEIRLGQKISDEVKTTVIDPAKALYEEQAYAFKCNDYLVDALEDMRMDEEFHEKVDDGTSVKIPPSLRGRLQLPPQALVKTNDGDFRYLNPLYQEADRKLQKTYIEYQAKQFEGLKKKAGGTDGLDPNLAASLGLEMSMSAEMTGEGYGGRRQKNQLRKSARGMSGSSSAVP